MKSSMPYIILIASTFLLSGALVVGTMVLRPDLLRMGPAHASAPAAAQPPTSKAGPKADTAAGKPRVTPPRDSLAIMRDSVRTLLAALDAERTKQQEAPGREPTPAPALAAPPAAAGQAPLPDSTSAKLCKARAKMLESMPAEDAARIIAKLSDEETKALLHFIKARQAAKILAAIEPERASRLFR